MKDSLLNFLKSKTIIWLLGGFFIILLCLIGVLIWQGLLQPESSISTETPPNVEKGLELPEEHGFILSMFQGELIPIIPGDVLLFYPPEAEKLTGSIAISAQDPTILETENDPTYIRIYMVNIEMKDTSGKIQNIDNLSSDLEVCFNVDNTIWNDYLSRPDYYEVQYYGDNNGELGWHGLPVKVYEERKQICGLSSHLTYFSLAIRVKALPTPTQTGTSTNTPTPTVTVTPGGPTPTITETPTITPSPTITQPTLPAGS